MAENHVDMSGEDCYEEDETGEQEETLLYFGGLFRREQSDRLKFISNFSKCVKSWVAKPDDVSAQSLLRSHLPTALRLSVNSPWSDIREGFIELLKEVQDLGYEIPKPVFTGPSSFIPRKDCVCYGHDGSRVQSALSQVQSQYEDAFMYDGRLSHMVQLMGYHPSYLSLWLKSHDFLMHGNGPLPLHVRNYLAILAASRHKCSYLVTVQEAEFLKNHGDKLWLKGIQYLPPKIRNLLHLNKLLAHQPWLVETQHVKDLLVGADNWSMSELVHALTLTAYYHALAGFCLGCGVNPELDASIGHTSPSKAGNDVHVQQGYYSNPALGFGGAGTPSDSESETVSPAARSPVARSPTHPDMGQSLVQHYIESTATEADEEGDSKMLSQSLMETLKTFENKSSSSDEDSDEQNTIMFEKTASSAGMDTQRPRFPVPTPVNLVKYIEDPEFEHEDFTSSAAGTLRAREYSWEDHGYPFLNSLYPDIGPLLDEKFKLALQMTYRMIGTEKVDTGPFREATWYYIHSIKGIRHDDYHYRRVNQVLDITYKTYIRMVGCFPEKVTSYNFLNCIQALEYSERIHVNILVLEARLQAELIYALRAIMNYMK